MLDRQTTNSYTHKMLNSHKLPALHLILLLSLLFAAQASGQHTPSPLVIFLVRHAEKVDTSSDAALSPAGKVRAQALATTLKDAGINHIHSSDYRRTRNTAAPIATLLAKEIQLYDPLKLSEFATKLKKAQGRHLVVGHSNTTPALAKLLGGESGSPIVEANEFDRLYIITISNDGLVNTVLLRYSGS